MTPRRIAASLRDLRRLHNLSQQELAARSHVSQAMISSIENGRRGCSDLIADALAAALNMSAADLRAGKCGHCEGSPPPGFACLTCGREGAR